MRLLTAPTMENIKQMLQNRWGFLIIIALGLDLRMGAAIFGHNYDMESWYIVADIMRHGGNVYAETGRYNYGPVWFLVLHVLDVLAAHRHEVLRYLIAGVLSLADLGIFLVLCRQAGRLAAVLFLLNPVSILISGYYGQFDNVAILLGLWSMLLFGDDFQAPLSRRKFFGLLLLGLSLMTKHLLFFFPVWLAVKQKGLGRKIIIIFVPSACFLLGFVPFWAGSHHGIIENVFDYQSYPGGFFYTSFIPRCIQFYCDSRTVWYGLLFLFAFICRTRNSFESLLIYTGVLVAFSPASTNQYLAIPIALASVFPSVFFFIYTAASTFHLCADVRNGPRVWAGLDGRHDYLAIYALCFAVVWLLWRTQFLRLFQKIWQEIRIQLGLLD
jgi:hypothetical protein